MSQAYSIGATTFKSFVWIKGGTLFKNPSYLEIEVSSPGAFGVEVVRPDGSVAGKAQVPNPHGGWLTFTFRSGGQFGAGISNGDYKIKLTNPSGSGERKVKEGRFEYDV